MVDLEYVKGLAEGDRHLAVLTAARPNGSPHASVVSAGIIDDPVDGSPSVGLVAIGSSRKLPLLRLDGAATIVFKHGYQWAAVSGPTRLIGPEDGLEFGLQCARHHPGRVPGGGRRPRGLGRVRPGHGRGSALRGVRPGREDLLEPRVRLSVGHDPVGIPCVGPGRPTRTPGSGSGSRPDECTAVAAPDRRSTSTGWAEVRLLDREPRCGDG